MMTQKVCSFCGRPIRPGTGLTVIMNDGSILRFCSNRCRKYMLEYKKDPRKLKWTAKYTPEV
ncbi:MAG: 50S ribosomal protein L24e [Nitrososphaeria archaeon]|jgi:large subunit ribosomal protein L24e